MLDPDDLEEMVREWGASLEKVTARDAMHPDWGAASRVHDWRNHVTPAVRSRWLRLSAEARIVAYMAAKDAADAEEWE